MRGTVKRRCRLPSSSHLPFVCCHAGIGALCPFDVQAAMGAGFMRLVGFVRLRDGLWKGGRCTDLLVKDAALGIERVDIWSGGGDFQGDDLLRSLGARLPLLPHRMRAATRCPWDWIMSSTTSEVAIT